MRLDVLMVERGLARTRSAAREAILRGAVIVNGAAATKPGQTVGPNAAILAEPYPFVSRGGHKLVHALDHFGIDVTGAHVLDLGASTGGFTDVLLRRGASHVTALDVAMGQLDPSLASNPRVTIRDGVNARTLSLGDLPADIALVVADVSFISLRLVLPAAINALPKAQLVCLFKPQFEVGHAAVGKGGIVRDEAAVTAAQAALAETLAQSGKTVVGWTASPIPGGDGNTELLFAAR